MLLLFNILGEKEQIIQRLSPNKSPYLIKFIMKPNIIHFHSKILHIKIFILINVDNILYKAYNLFK